MPIITPVPIPPAPPAPQRNDPATFEERNDAAVEYQFNTLPGAIDQQSEATYQNALFAKDQAEIAEQHKDAAEQAAIAADEDAQATAADRVQTGLDAQATAEDRVQTGLDRVATAADRVQTGLDRQAVADGLASIADGPVTRVNGKTGDVTLIATDIAPAATAEEMEVGTETNHRSMSPALVAEAIRHLAPVYVDQIFIAQHEVPSGVSGGDSVSNEYTQRVINTVLINTIDGASLSGNEVHLPAGRYEVFASAPAHTAAHHIRIRNRTTGVTELNGSSEKTPAAGTITRSFAIGELLLALPCSISVDHWVDYGVATGLGLPTSGGVPAVFTQIRIRKIA